jgi:16S rRNA processing protein RimM
MHRADSDLLTQVQSVTLVRGDGQSVVASLERVAPMGRGYRVKFEGCNDRDAAERLRGATLSVPRSHLPELDTGENYLVDLLGAKVIGPQGEEVGKVSGIQSYPSVDAVVIERPDGTIVEQPLVDSWVADVDSELGTITLSRLDGLL